MRRKTFNVLFETKDEMAILGKEHCMWRSLWYFVLSLGLFCGVVSNYVLSAQTLVVRFAVVAAILIVLALLLAMYGFLLHGILETVGATSGNPVSLICLLGYTVLPFMVLTPVAFLSTKYGFTGILIFGATFAAGMLWMLYLLMRALEAVYIIDFIRAFAVVCFSVLMLGIVFVMPVCLAVKLVLLQLAP
jgi:hypothetical protein